MGYRPRGRKMLVADPGTASVVSLPDLRAHLRVSELEPEFTVQIASCARAAVDAIERETQRLLIPRQVTLLLPGLPSSRGAVELPGGRVASVASVTVDGQAVAGFEVYGDSPAVLVPDADWPVVTGEGYPVEIVYTAGYQSVPPALVSAIKMMVEDLFDRPDGAGPDRLSDLARRARHLAAHYRIRPA